MRSGMGWCQVALQAGRGAGGRRRRRNQCSRCVGPLAQTVWGSHRHQLRGRGLEGLAGGGSQALFVRGGPPLGGGGCLVRWQGILRLGIRHGIGHRRQHMLLCDLLEQAATAQGADDLRGRRGGGRGAWRGEAKSSTWGLKWQDSLTDDRKLRTSARPCSPERCLTTPRRISPRRWDLPAAGWPRSSCRAQSQNHLQEREWWRSLVSASLT